jgi:Holliday junction resolvase RusA-like endonuclease
MIEFFLVCVPPSANHQNKRIVKIGHFARLADKPELLAAKEMIDGLLVPHRPHAPLAGPLTLTLEFTWPWRAGDSAKVRARGRVPMTVRPDCSNLAKTTEDRLAALRFLEDDALVCELVVRKFRGDHPGIGVRLEACLDPVQAVLPPGALVAPREVGLLV